MRRFGLGRRHQSDGYCISTQASGFGRPDADELQRQCAIESVRHGRRDTGLEGRPMVRRIGANDLGQRMQQRSR